MTVKFTYTGTAADRATLLVTWVGEAVVALEFLTII